MRGLQVRQRPPPAVSIQREIWSSFWRKSTLLWFAGGATLEIWALFKKSQCRGESDWTSLFVQWVMTAVVREQRGAVLLQFENFLDWINGQIPTWLTPYLPAYLNTAMNSEVENSHEVENSRIVWFWYFLLVDSQFIGLCGSHLSVPQSCDSIDWWLNYHRADRQLLWSFMISFKLFFSQRICLAWGYQGEK